MSLQHCLGLRFTTVVVFFGAFSALGAVKSSDFFDTLVGRYQYEPKSIFRLMGRELRDPQWEHVRIKAERDARGGLIKIYNVLGRALNLAGEDLERLRQMEILLEASNLFPIHENISLLEPGDWIVSDTYYTEAELRGLMRAVGINEKSYHVYASLNDKSSGTFWRDKAAFYGITSHLGDNIHADVTQARKYGINARHYIDGRLNDFEQGLWNQGYQQLAACCRMVRLRRPQHIPAEFWSMETMNCLLSSISRYGCLTEGLAKEQLQGMPHPLAAAEMHHLIIGSLYFYPNLEREIRAAYGKL